jgi:hypothetical protein
MTEMEQLKKNTEEQYAKEKFAALFAWTDEVEAEWDLAIKESKKNLNITLVVIIVQMILGFGFNSPLWILCYLLWLILFMRQGVLQARCQKHRGRLNGAFKALYLLGMADIDIEQKRGKKRKIKRFTVSPFKRFKEFFERMGAKNKQEAHA